MPTRLATTARHVREHMRRHPGEQIAERPGVRILVLLAFASACFETEDIQLGEPTVSRAVQLEFPISGTAPFDILVVVDRSPAMVAHAENVAANLPRMIEWARFPNMHLGVIAADGDGSFETAAAVDGEHIVDLELTDGTHLRNYEGTLADVFATLAAPQGDGGTARPLEALRRALTSHPTFRRADAFLLVVVLSASDDASPDAPETYVDFVTSLAPEGRIAVSAAMPVGDCGTAPRLAAFTSAFEDRALVHGICEPDLSRLLALASPKTTLAGPPCLPALAEPSACAAELVFGHGGGERLPWCGEGSAPCWEVNLAPIHCSGNEPHAFTVKRALLDELPLDTIVRADCLLAP